MRRVLITGDFNFPDAVFPDDFEVIHIKSPANEQEIKDVLSTITDYIVGGPEFLSTEMIDCAERLQHVVVMGTGTASFIDIAYAEKRGIRISNTPGMNFSAVVDFTLAMIKVCSARVFESVEYLKSGRHWLQSARPAFSSQRIGFIGMGAIAKSMVGALHREGCRDLQYWSRSRKTAIEDSYGIRHTSLNEMIKNIDILCIHVTGGSETYHLVNESVLSNASPTLSIFNLSSPNIICPAALKNYLLANQGAFCFIDGYYCEWVENKGALSDSYNLLSLPSSSFVATSHIAAQEEAVLSAMLARSIALVCEPSSRTE